MVAKKIVKAKVKPEIAKEGPTEQEKKLAEALKNFKCSNPQSQGNEGCGGTKATESARGELVCLGCGWTQPIKK